MLRVSGAFAIGSSILTTRPRRRKGAGCEEEEAAPLRLLRRARLSRPRLLQAPLVHAAGGDARGPRIRGQADGALRQSARGGGLPQGRRAEEAATSWATGGVAVNMRVP